MRFSLATLSFFLASMTFSSVIAAPAQQEPRNLVDSVLLDLLPPSLVQRLVADGQLVLQLGPGQVVNILEMDIPEKRQEPITGPIGNGVACAAGCVPI